MQEAESASIKVLGGVHGGTDEISIVHICQATEAREAHLLAFLRYVA